MKPMWSIICSAIGFLLVLESVVGENAKPAENDGVPLSDSNATSLNLAMTPNNEDNADDNSTASSSAISSSSLGNENENSSKTSSNLTQGPSANTYQSNETSTINSTENGSQDSQSTTTHNNGELSSEVSAVTTSSGSTTALSKSSSSSKTDASEGGTELTNISKDEESETRARLLVAVVKTLVTTSITSSTSTVFATCVTGSLPTNACTRRRKKRSQLLKLPLHDEQYLDPSVLDPSLNEAKSFVPARRAGRLIIWSSSVQTVTFVATSTNADTTISASFFCSFAALPSACA